MFSVGISILIVSIKQSTFRTKIPFIKKELEKQKVRNKTIEIDNRQKKETKETCLICLCERRERREKP